MQMWTSRKLTESAVDKRSKDMYIGHTRKEYRDKRLCIDVYNFHNNNTADEDKSQD